MSVELCHRPFSILHCLISNHLHRFVEQVEKTGRFLPSFVHRELERFLACGDPKNGFAWLQCKGCNHNRIVPFSCKARGFCPTCGGRRMVVHATRWVDEMFPRVPVRQVVMTVPWKRRWLLARKPDLIKGVLKIGLREIQKWYKRRARQKGLINPQCGMVTAVQRFGSALNLNVHFHTLMMDGVYATDPKTGWFGFHRLPKMTTDDVSDLVVRIGLKVETWLDKQGYGQYDEFLEDDPEDGLGVIQGATIAGRVAMGKRAGQRARRVQLIQGKEYKLPKLCSTFRGYNLHCGVVVSARNRKGLEGLCRYILRPPLAKDRLRKVGGNDYELKLKTPWADGTTSLRLSSMEVMERLTSLIPPPKVHQVIYHGVFASRSKWRKKVLPLYTKGMKERRLEKRLLRLSKKKERGNTDVYRTSWTYLLRRTFGAEGFECPRCSGVMELRMGQVFGVMAQTLLLSLTGKGRAPPKV